MTPAASVVSQPLLPRFYKHLWCLASSCSGSQACWPCRNTSVPVWPSPWRAGSRPGRAEQRTERPWRTIERSSGPVSRSRACLRRSPHRPHPRCSGRRCLWPGTCRWPCPPGSGPSTGTPGYTPSTRAGSGGAYTPCTGTFHSAHTQLGAFSRQERKESLPALTDQWPGMPPLWPPVQAWGPKIWRRGCTKKQKSWGLLIQRKRSTQAAGCWWCLLRCGWGAGSGGGPPWGWEQHGPAAFDQMKCCCYCWWSLASRWRRSMDEW